LYTWICWRWFFYVSQWEIQYLGNLWQILIFSGVP
jgi:hypothetical protein